LIKKLESATKVILPFISFVPFFGFSLFLTMPTYAKAASFATFYGSEGRLGQAFLTGVKRSIKSVNHLVVSSGIPVTAPKMRKQFGHMVTQTTAKSMKGAPTFQTPCELQISMQQQFQAWNITNPPEERILMLQRKPVIGILAVVWH
jgi:hypothetical protein